MNRTALILLACLPCPAWFAATTTAAQLQSGPMLGHTTANSAQIWAKASGPAKLGLRISKMEDLSKARALTPVTPITPVTLQPRSDFMATLRVPDLEPDTRYYYQLSLDGEPAGEIASFTTAPADGELGVLRFAFTSCLGKKGAEAAAGWKQMASSSWADLVLLLGDNHYADTTARAGQSAAYLDHRSVAGFKNLAPRVPIYGIWDDHDFGPNDSDGTAEGKEASLATFKDFWANPAYGEPDNPGVYYRFARSGVEFFMLDCRYYRSPDGAPQDGTKTMLGARQLAWLKAGLKASTAKVKVVATGSEWQLNGHRDSWTSYKRERAEVLDFIEEEKVTGVLLLSGDRHFTGGYQVRGEVIEVTAGPLGSKNFPSKNLPEMFLNHGEGKMFCVLDINTAAEPNPHVTLEVHRAGKGLIDKRNLSWPQVLGEEGFEFLPVPPKPKPKPKPQPL